MTKSTLDCSYLNQEYDEILSSITLKTVDDSLLTPIYLSGGNTTLSQNTYTNCLGALNGGVIMIDTASIVSDTSSSYLLNAAYNGGLFYLKGGSTLTINRCVRNI